VETHKINYLLNVKLWEILECANKVITMR